MPLLNDLKRTIDAEKLIKKRDRLLIACSGGPDSVALTYLLNALREELGLKLALAHFNHGLRGREAKADEAFVKNLGRQMGLRVYTSSGNVRAAAKKNRFSLEEAARYMRYKFLLGRAKRLKYNKLVFGHNKDDQAETVLMRILQGTGMRGLEGIRPRMKRDGITVIRPLLGFTKKEILDFLETHKLHFRQDRSNASKRFVRNRIRIELLPEISRQINPRAVEALSRIPAIVRAENEVISSLEKTAWKMCFKRRRQGRLELDREALNLQPAAIQYRILDQALKRLDPKSGMSYDGWTRFRPSLKRIKTRYSLPRDIDVSLTPSKLTLYKKHDVR